MKKLEKLKNKLSRLKQKGEESYNLKLNTIIMSIIILCSAVNVLFFALRTNGVFQSLVPEISSYFSTLLITGAGCLLSDSKELSYNNKIKKLEKKIENELEINKILAKEDAKEYVEDLKKDITFERKNIAISKNKLDKSKEELKAKEKLVVELTKRLKKSKQSDFDSIELDCDDNCLINNNFI